MASLRVAPRQTPGEHADVPVEVEIDETLALHAATLEEWANSVGQWELSFRQGHDFGRPDNVEAKLLFSGPGHACSLSFRLDQLDSIHELGDELWLILEERDGIAKGIHLAPGGFDLELYHIVGPPLGETSA
jgi:hypothetical protein